MNKAQENTKQEIAFRHIILSVTRIQTYHTSNVVQRKPRQCHLPTSKNIDNKNYYSTNKQQ